MIYNLWQDFEKAFENDEIKVRPKRPDIDALFDQEEHLIHTNKGQIHIFVQLETVGTEILPILTYHAANKQHSINFILNGGLTVAQHLSHALRVEHGRMMAG